ncbi:MAG: 6-bladed beta-propeller [Cyclobacteriaceae bacterium]|nr:6-bladed beta-propeller [Cyclobacteriaceae bacterium]
MNENTLIKIPVSGLDNQVFEDKFEINRIIALDFCDACIIGEVHKILIDDSGFYVLDKTITKSIKKFDWNGTLLFNISESGEGLGKYILPFDMELDKNRLFVLDVNQRKILFFNAVNGQFDNEQRIGDFQALTFAHLDNNTFAYHLDGRELGPDLHYLGQIAALGGGKSTAKWVLDFGNTDYMTAEQEFTRGEKGLLFAKSMNDTVYQVEASGFIPKYVFDFGDKRISDDIKKADMMEAMQRIMTDWPHFHWGRVFENSNQVFFLWSGNQGQRNLSYYDKVTGVTYLLEGDSFYPKNIVYVDDQRLIAFISPEEYMESDLKGVVKEYRNPVLVSYTFKSK